MSRPVKKKIDLGTIFCRHVKIFPPPLLFLSRNAHRAPRVYKNRTRVRAIYRRGGGAHSARVHAHIPEQRRRGPCFLSLVSASLRRVAREDEPSTRGDLAGARKVRTRVRQLTGSPARARLPIVLLRERLCSPMHEAVPRPRLLLEKLPLRPP